MMKAIVTVFAFAFLLPLALCQTTDETPTVNATESEGNETAGNLTGRFINIFGIPPPVSEVALATNPFSNILQLFTNPTGGNQLFSGNLAYLLPFLLQANLSFSDLLLSGIFNQLGGQGYPPSGYPGGLFPPLGGPGYPPSGYPGGYPSVCSGCSYPRQCRRSILGTYTCVCPTGVNCGAVGSPSACTSCYPPRQCQPFLLGTYRCVCPTGVYCPPPGIGNPSGCSSCYPPRQCQLNSGTYSCVCPAGLYCPPPGGIGNPTACSACYPPRQCQTILGVSRCVCPANIYCPPQGPIGNPTGCSNCYAPRQCQTILGVSRCVCPANIYCPPQGPIGTPTGCTSCYPPRQCQTILGVSRCVCPPNAYCPPSGPIGNPIGCTNCSPPRQCQTTFGISRCVCPPNVYCPPGPIGIPNGCSNCIPPYQCQTTLGISSCVCPPGVNCGVVGPRICTPSCPSSAWCNMNPGPTYGQCVCRQPGYTWNGQYCVLGGSACGQCQDHATCLPTGTGYSCQCESGYTLVGSSCVSTNTPICNPPCPSSAYCVGLPGSAYGQCVCILSGYSWNGQYCARAGSACGQCQEHASCLSSGTGFSCQCDSGYTLVGSSCLASVFPQCPQTCTDGAVCQLTSGQNFECVCPISGYIWDGSGCTLPSPSTGNDGQPVCREVCPLNSVCIDLGEKNECVCLHPYAFDGNNCVDASK